MKRRELENHLTVAQCAELLSVDESTVHRWIKAGHISPIAKLGRRCVRIPASAVNRFLESRSVGDLEKAA